MFKLSRMQPNLSDKTVIEELDKFMLYNDVLKSDEIAIVGKDEKFIYSFREDLPNILQDKITKTDSSDIEKYKDLSKCFDDFLSNKPNENILFDRDFATKITVHWPTYVKLPRKNTEFLISAYPVDRFVPFAINGDRFLKEVDIIPIIESYPKCLNADQLIKRIMDAYKDKWECFYGKWDRFEKKPIYIR